MTNANAEEIAAAITNVVITSPIARVAIFIVGPFCFLSVYSSSLCEWVRLAAADRFSFSATLGP
jgi:hypothetical protein